MEWTTLSPSVRSLNIDWVPGNRRLQLAVMAYTWTATAVVVGFFAVLVLHNFRLLRETPVQGATWTVVALAVTVFLSILLWVSRLRPGSFDIGVSPWGLSVRFPLRTRTFPWSDLVWYSDRMRVEGRSGWRGPPLLALTPAQFERVQRWFHPQ
jgi:hypothetical protein